MADGVLPLGYDGAEVLAHLWVEVAAHVELKAPCLFDLHLGYAVAGIVELGFGQDHLLDAVVALYPLHFFEVDKSSDGNGYLCHSADGFGLVVFAMEEEQVVVES